MSDNPEFRKYKIVRNYFRDDLPRRTIKKGLTLQQAQEHCSNPETSSKTCTKYAGKQRTKVLGDWFDGYDPQ